MTGIDIFWFFLMLSALQPVLKQKMLEAARQRMIAKIEKNRSSRVILLVHRQETMSLLGFPVMKYIDINDSEQVIRAIRMTDDNIPIDLLLHTPGGLVLAALQIARAVKDHKAKVTAIVPHYAMSGGTLIAMSADEIIMDRHAVLGPVDPQLGQYPAASLLRVRKEKSIDRIDDETLIRADMAEKALNQMKKDVIELLEDRMGRDKAEKLAETMSQGKWTHDYPISCDEAKGLGLSVNSNLPREFYQLMNLFPQPIKREPTVEYLPIPKHKDKNSGQTILTG